MHNKIIETKNAPSPIGPYSQAVQHGNMLFISGQVAINPVTGELENADVASETKQVMENLKSILDAASTSFDKVIKTTIFLTDMEYFTTVNEIYGQYFNGVYPARETIAVKGLPRKVNVEISMIASV